MCNKVKSNTILPLHLLRRVAVFQAIIKLVKEAGSQLSNKDNKCSTFMHQNIFMKEYASNKNDTLT